MVFGMQGLSVRARALLPDLFRGMNKTEARYAALLQADWLRGKIARWDFEPVTLRLADRTSYTPDFRVILPDGLEEYHEVKGFWRDDARVKIKVAAALHPYRFVAVKMVGGTWKREEIGA